MITKNDCLLLLGEISTKGIDTKEYITKTLKTNKIDLDVLKFINDNRPLELTQFYEKLRKYYNNKK